MSGERLRDAHLGRQSGGVQVRRSVVGRASAMAAGSISAAAALGASELVAGIASDGGPSLVSSVGTEFIDRFAGGLEGLAVTLFGTNDKVALVVGIVVVSLTLGAVCGAAARRRFQRGAVGFVAFGALGAWAASVDPLGSMATGLVAALVAVLVGVGALWVLLRMAPRRSAALSQTTGAGAAPATGSRRRAFLAVAATVSAVAATSAGAGRTLRTGGSSAAARRAIRLPPVGSSVDRPPAASAPVVTRPASPPPSSAPATTSEAPDVAPPPTTAPAPDPFAVPGLTPYVTPNDAFYRIDTALIVPQVDLATWRLDLSGLVYRPFSLSYDELLSLDAVEATVTLQCVSNEVGGRLVDNAVWQGVSLEALLERAGPQIGASQIIGRSQDDWTAGFRTAVARDGRVALVAYGMNNEPLPIEHGFPARLVVAGLYGYVSATKWLREIELTRFDDVDGYWIARGWAKEGPVKTMSRIDVPTSAAILTPGPTPIAGVAWAPDRGISRVEVQVDDGDWQECVLGDVASDATWVQWVHQWDATPGAHVARVRAIDGDGVTQTSALRDPIPDGATGWHSRRVRVAG